MVKSTTRSWYAYLLRIISQYSETLTRKHILLKIESGFYSEGTGKKVLTLSYLKGTMS